MRMNHLLLIGAVAVAGYMLGPQLRTHVLPFLSSFRGFNMRLDPGEVSPNVEDRRGEHRGGRGGPWGDLSRDAGGGDITRMPWPRGGGGGGGAPWDEAQGEGGPGGSFPGGFPGGGGGGLRCRDTRTGQDVPLSFCERERMGRR